MTTRTTRSKPTPAEPQQGKEPVAPKQAGLEQAVLDAAIRLTEFKQTGYGRQDPWWKREALWCHFCVQNIEMGQEHREGCPAMELEAAVKALVGETADEE